MIDSLHFLKEEIKAEIRKEALRKKSGSPLDCAKLC